MLKFARYQYGKLNRYTTSPQSPSQKYRQLHLLKVRKLPTAPGHARNMKHMTMLHGILSAPRILAQRWHSIGTAEL